jgi:hypothetical protein
LELLVCFYSVAAKSRRAATEQIYGDARASFLETIPGGIFYKNATAGDRM